MSRTEDLKNLDRTIRDAEIRIRTLRTSLVALDVELGNLDALRQTLEANITCLKTSKVVALAAEYKKSKDELKRIRDRVAVLNRDRVHFGTALKEVESLLKKSVAALEKLNKPDGNVLLFKRGKKDG